MRKSVDTAPPAKEIHCSTIAVSEPIFSTSRSTETPISTVAILLACTFRFIQFKRSTRPSRITCYFAVEFEERNCRPDASCRGLGLQIHSPDTQCRK